MSAKEYLMRSRRLQARIDQLEKARQSAWDAATSTTVSAGKESVQSSDVTRKPEAYSMLLSEIDRERGRLDSVKAETLHTIDMVQDNTSAALLTGYYINSLSWEEVSVQLHYCYKHVVHALHPRALAEVDKILESGNTM